MKRVLLTGAGGFVGHHTLEHLLVNTDWEIVCLDSFRHRGKTSRIREVLDGLEGSPDTHGITYAEGPAARRRVRVLAHDLRAPIDAQLDREIGHIDYVVSMASESHVDRSCVEPRPFIENNVALVLTLLEWMRVRNTMTTVPITKFLHVSTDEVYGPAPAGHNHVEGEPHRPSNPYSASKACQEDIVYSYWRTFGLPVAISNTMNIIGERQDPEKFVPLVLSKVLKHETVTIHASPKGQPGSRFYLHARNQADALLFLLKTQPFPRYGEGDLWHYEPRGAMMVPVDDGLARWNVVGEQEIDNLAMAEMIADYAGETDTFRYELTDFHSSRPGHDLRYALDGRLMEHLGWTPPLPLAESLERTVRWTLEPEHRHWLLP